LKEEKMDDLILDEIKKEQNKEREQEIKESIFM